MLVLLYSPAGDCPGAEQQNERGGGGGRPREGKGWESSGVVGMTTQQPGLNKAL